MPKTILITVACAVGIGTVVMYVYRAEVAAWFFSPTAHSVPSRETQILSHAPEIVAKGLAIPWELVFLPGGDMLLTERAGRVLRISANKEVIEVPGVVHRGEGGLLGLALHPQFSSNGWIYLYLTTATKEGLSNRVERYVLDGTTLSDRKVILEKIPGAATHDGGRIAFGPDGNLYIATGDAGEGSNAQRRTSLAGKILRIHDDGSIPVDNPFGNAVYSYGHRNIQGLAWDSGGQLWATEHGRSGIQSGYDELNRIEKGGNYGWPLIEGDETRAGMIVPQLHSGAAATWAPSGMAYVQDRIIFAGLRGQALYVADISTGTAQNLTMHLRESYGRLRTVVVGSDGMLYALTNNRDGRGTPQSDDDRIIKIHPQALGLPIAN